MQARVFRFAVEVRRDGILLATAEASVAPCIEDALFRGVVAGALPNDGTVPPYEVRPIWLATGPPAVGGITLENVDGAVTVHDLRVFAPCARAIVRDLLRAKRLAQGDRVVWSVVATEQPPVVARRFRTRGTRAPYPLRRGRLPGAEPGTFSVTIQAGVLEEIRCAVLAEPMIECAGLLIGHLVHDPERGAAALAVTGQLRASAGRGGSSDSHFSFGPDSFLALRRDLLALAGETVAVGWFHSHPPPCELCPENPMCKADTVFFSADDVQVHASAFPAAYLVGLVAGKMSDRRATDPGFRLFGWQGGAIEELPFEIGAAQLAYGCEPRRYPDPKLVRPEDAPAREAEREDSRDVD